MQKIPWRDLLLIVLIAVIARALLLASQSVSFHSDEAIIGLMARHINQGARPTFFYGQAYMGSLDAWLVALGFRLLGDTVLSIRLVESLLYLLVVATGYLIGWQFSGKRLIAAVTGLTLAVPAVNTALYTTATLGGYNETLLFGNLILLLGYAVAHEHGTSLWRWALLGLITGAAWWTNGLIVMYVLPLSLMLLWRWWRQRVHIVSLIPLLALALAGFAIGSAPWWVFDFSHQHAALATFLSSRQTGEFEGIGLPYVPPPQRALGLLLVGIPALIGLRFPWESNYFLLPLGVLVLLIYLGAGIRLSRGPNPLRPDARLLLLLLLAVFAAIFIASTFGADPTGRYFLPLTLPLGILLGTAVDAAWQSGAARPLALALVAVVVGYQALGQIAAAHSATGFTTQFDLISHIPNDHDAELIDFLEAHDLNYGYTNYWISFRLAFLSHEQLQYSASLPYKADLSYNAADKRYAAYDQATESAARYAIILTGQPEALAQRLIAMLDAQQIGYKVAPMGDFRVYYDFTPTLPVMNWSALRNP